MTSSIALVPLSGNTNKVACVSQEDLHLVINHTWWLSNYNNTTQYTYTTINKRTVRMHQLLSPGVEVDHINRNGLDNRRENLREVTRIQNIFNRTIAASIAVETEP